MAMLDKSLRGVRVLDFSRLFPGPLCTLLMADMGANVIKIESPEGDPARNYPPLQQGMGAIFRQLNRGKRSVMLDWKSEPSREIIWKLLSGCDVLVESFRPGVMKRVG